jgi:hypothetical protein
MPFVRVTDVCRKSLATMCRGTGTTMEDISDEGQEQPFPNFVDQTIVFQFPNRVSASGLRNYDLRTVNCSANELD